MNTSDDLFQRSVYVGINLEDILYGIELVLYFKTMHVLLSHRERTKPDVFYAIFSSVMLLMITIWVSMQALFGQKMWVQNADFPNDPNAFWAANISDWYMDVASMAVILLQFMADALMVYRCWIIWNSYRVIIIPSILCVGTLVLGVLLGWSSAASGGFYFHHTVVQLGLAYFSVSVFLTTMLTCMICYRLVWYGRLMKEHLGHEYASMYFGVVTLVVESVLPCTLSGIAFLISLGIGSQAVTMFGYIHALMMCISPQALILRAAMRISVSDTVLDQPPSTVKFSPRGGTTSGAVSKVSEGVHPQASGSSRKNDDSIV